MPAFTLRLDDDTHERLRSYAHERRVSMNRVSVAAIGAYLDLMEGLNDAEQARSDSDSGGAGSDVT